MFNPLALNHIRTFGSRSYPGTGKAVSGHSALRKRPSYRDGVPKKRPGRKAGVPPRFHTAVASANLGANVDNLFLGLQLIFIVGLLSYRRAGREGGGAIAGEASRPRRRLPGDPHPSPTSKSPGARQLRTFPPPPRLGRGAAALAMRPPTRRGLHPCRCPYAHIKRRRTRGRDRRELAVLGCRRAVVSVSSPCSSSSGFCPSHCDARPLPNPNPRASVRR